MPLSRYRIHAGILTPSTGVDQFDPSFFGLSPREVARMDPQQRLLLEVSWEALERAGQVVAQLAGSQTGIFFGISTNDYFHLQLAPSNIGDAYLETGNRHSFAAGRLSYLLDLQGPSLTVDTVCSSSLVALHLACQALRNGECNLVLAGGVNLILSPLSTMMTSRLHALSMDGRCKTLDAKANGFVRSEGCGVVVLKRLSDALADRDLILALIRGSAVNHDGRSTALTAPNGRAQQAVIRQALANARVAPEQIGYVEIHGTGTPLGDPIEIEALTAVLGQSREARQRCVLGALKTNIGHTEAAAGIASVIKAVLALEHGEIPANIHFQQLNPHISLDESTFVIPTETLAWPAEQNRRRYAGVSSFGLSGTNAHVILEESLSPVAPVDANLPNTAYVLPLSAHTPKALRILAQAYVNTLQEQAGQGQATSLQLRDICYTASMRRDHYEQRAAVVARSPKQLVEQLQSFVQGQSAADSLAGRNDLDQPRCNIVFVFSGQGSQYVGMGLRLAEQEEVFRKQLQTCDEILRHYVSWSLLEELSAPVESSRLNRTEIAQPIICAFQISLAALWRSWGITPDAVVGHSMGEIAAAYVAGALSLQESLRLAALRGRLMQEAAGQGEMAVVELSAAELAPFLQDYQLQSPQTGGERTLAPAASPERTSLPQILMSQVEMHQGQIDIAAYNSPTTTILSGVRQALEEVIANVQQRGIFCRMLEVGFAFHSYQMAPYQVRLQQELSREHEWQPKATVIPFFSTVLQRQVAGEELDATYWGQNVGEPVRFVGAVQQLLAEGFDCFLELSPHPVMRHALLQTLRLSTAAWSVAQKGEKRQAGLVVGSLQRGKDEREALLQALGTLYSSGVAIEWSALYPQAGNCVCLPTYPFQRERFWYDEKQASNGQVRCAVSHERMHPLLPIHTISSLQQGTQYWDGTVSLGTAPYLADHCVQEVAVLPGVVYLETAIMAAQQAYPGTIVTLKQVRFQQMLPLTDEQTGPQHHQLALCLQKGTQATSDDVAQQHLHFQYSSRHQKQSEWTLHATGSIVLHSAAASLPKGVCIATIQARCPQLRD
ncbi:MAG: type I polyketide synthase [Chloroflexi bacterium]|nr:MAG: type I polyketide synthase [Chloroflexota bacterium]